MNPDWERKVIPEALRDLQSSISVCPTLTSRPPDRPLEERKLDYIHVEEGAEALSPGSINKSISELLARNRARNDASNRAEFLHSCKGRHSSNASEGLPLSESDEVESVSCARTDAKTVDREVMMKFDIAKNEEGPLRRTLKVEVKGESNGPTARIVGDDNSVTANRYPGLDERLKNLETHLAMRYVPSPPASLLHRIKFIEDHIIQLERDYPSWAALHFNQPRRGWPPPPRKAVTEVRTKGRASRSSLHRAVLEKLEVQRAIEDFKGEGEHE
ncbi:hypothetical protein B0F90DRAFT_1808742 [Multifurca ochricompacta]|uniref:Uncharacterized protein n=1 Tax=Multifurca ochricompacta TaxID=376703 RepID=A0AAD4M816_9AGAM|nr:hypothetical protein B0F90DRAFT_1808742 [Multifurca ochricompacta]